MGIDRLVIAGAGLAGMRAATAARQAGFEGQLTVVGDEPHAPYTRPPLSKQLLAGEQEPEQVALPGRDRFDAEWLLGTPAAAVDRQARELRLADGRSVPYDRLIIATGTRARPWPGEGAALRGIHTLRTLDDALALRDVLRGCPDRLVIVGAGFVGSEVAATAAGAGVPVTLVDVAPHPVMPFGPELGALVAARHEQAGVDVRTGSGVEHFEDDGAGALAAVVLADGTRIETAHALVALGAVPNTEWLAGSGIDPDPAVPCDATLTTLADQDVLAAGDLASWPHPLAGGRPVRVEHWTTAAEHGQLAGRNALLDPGDREPHVAPPFFWSDQYDLKLQAAGLPGQAETLEPVERDPDGGRAVYAGRSDGRLVAVVAVNAVARLGWYRQQLAAGAAWDDVLAAVAADEKALGAPV